MEIAFIIVVVVAVVAAVLLWSPPGAALRQRLEDIGDNEIVSRGILLQRSFRDRGLAPLVRFLADAAKAFTPDTQRAKLVRSMQLAGFNHRFSVETFLAVKVLALVSGVLGFLVLVPVNQALGWCVGSTVAGLGFAVPSFWLRARVAKRNKEIVRSLPQVIDLITACVEAGLSFDAAIQQVQPTLGQQDAAIGFELARYLSDVAMGQIRSVALLEMAERTGVADLRGVMAAVVQGDQLGQGIGTTLRAQSQHLRTRRRQQAQEEAMKAPVKILLPLVFFIFPAMFVVILGPGVLKLVDALGNVAANAK